MKKITLAVLTAFSFFDVALGQANFTIQAPQYNNAISQFRAPNGTAAHTVQRTVFYIHHNELLPMNIGSINSFSFQYIGGTGSLPVAGNFTVWLENTNDQSYQKGSSFSAAVAPMQVVYNSVYTVPSSTGPSTVGVTLSSPFTYTGGGLYIAYDWSSSGPFSVAEATYRCNNNEPWCATSEATVAPAPDALTLSLFRPALLWKAVNTATNEVEVLEILADGKVAKLHNTPQTIYANVLNSASVAATNVSVALTTPAPNVFTQVQVIPTIASGGIGTATFTGFNPQTNGLVTMSVAALVNDQNLSNNLRTWTQSVTCNEMGGNPPVPTFKSSYGAGSSPFIFAFGRTIPTTSSLTAIRWAVGSTTLNAGKAVSGVLLDGAGAIIAYSTNTITISSSQLGTFVNLNFAKEDLTAGTPYMFGVLQQAGGYYPMAIFEYTASIPPYDYYTVPATGGAPSLIQNADGFLGIEPVLVFPATEMLATTTRSAVCVKFEKVTLNAVGSPTSYVWSSNAGAVTSSSVTLTPTVAGISGTGTAVYSVWGTDPVSGCKTATATVQVKINTCTGLMDAEAAANIKIYPNPATNGKCTVSGLQSNCTITVFNTLGQAVADIKTSGEEATIDLSGQAAGNYIIKITNSSRESRILKMVNQ
jgi:hypothetical protein